MNCGSCSDGHSVGGRAMADALSIDPSFTDHRRQVVKSPLLGGGGAGIPALGAAAAAEGTQGDARGGTLSKGLVGFMLAHEQFTAPELLTIGYAAERAGFDLLATSDHFQPWQANERHAGQAWVTLGALGQKTQRVWMGPTVTC